MSDSPDRHLVWKVAALGLAMFAFGFALVPLYDVICAVTGFGGKTASVAAVVAEQPDPSRTVRVEFLASVASGAPFTLEPEVGHLEVHPGQLYETHFRARNLTGSPLTAQAVPRQTFPTTWPEFDAANARLSFAAMQVRAKSSIEVVRIEPLVPSGVRDPSAKRKASSRPGAVSVSPTTRRPSGDTPLARDEKAPPAPSPTPWKPGPAESSSGPGPGRLGGSVPDAITTALSARELEVLLLLDEHLSTDAIADRLYISEHTVRSHVKSLLRKLGVSSRRAALEQLALARR